MPEVIQIDISWPEPVRKVDPRHAVRRRVSWRTRPAVHPPKTFETYAEATGRGWGPSDLLPVERFETYDRRTGEAFGEEYLSEVAAWRALGR